MTMTAWPAYSNANLYFDKKKNRKMAKYTAKLTFLWYDNFGMNQTPLQRNGITAIPKICFELSLNLLKMKQTCSATLRSNESARSEKPSPRCWPVFVRMMKYLKRKVISLDINCTKKFIFIKFSLQAMCMNWIYCKYYSQVL